MPPKTNAKRHFIEETGIVLERAEFPRMSGRILGYLMISTASEISSDELVEELEASRGSVSTGTRLLIQLGMVDRVGRSGDRRDYFRLRPNAWAQLLKARMQNIIDFHRVIEHGLAAVDKKDTEPLARLEEVHVLYEFFEREFAAMLKRWDDQQTVRPKK